jgi:hypothetical protein
MVLKLWFKVLCENNLLYFAMEYTFLYLRTTEAYFGNASFVFLFKSKYFLKFQLYKSLMFNCLLSNPIFSVFTHTQWLRKGLQRRCSNCWSGPENRGLPSCKTDKQYKNKQKTEQNKHKIFTLLGILTFLLLCWKFCYS